MNALSKSYSQFVPGYTGINTLGFAIGSIILVIILFSFGCTFALISLASIPSLTAFLVGNIFSSGFSQFSIKLSISISVPFIF